MPDKEKNNDKVEVVVDTSYFTTMERWIQYEELGQQRKTKPYMEFLCEHKIIASWNLDGNPQELDRLMVLAPQEWKAVNEKVVEKINKLFQ